MTSTRRNKPVDWGRPAGMYRLFGVDGGLLYIGIGFNPTTRLWSHSRTKRWWFLVDQSRTTVTWYDTWIDAAHAEVRAIQVEDPKFNYRSLEIPVVDQSSPTVKEIAQQQMREAAGLAALNRIKVAARRHGHAAPGQRAATRAELHASIVDAFRVGVRPNRVRKVSPYDRNYNRQIAEAAGVPALRPATVVSKTRVTD